MPDQVPPERGRRALRPAGRGGRGERLVGGARSVSAPVVEVLIAEGEGRKDAATLRLSGRARDNRLVHVADCDARPGDVVQAVVSQAAPHHLMADEVIGVRRTRGGDAWQARRETPAATGVLLGMPGRPRSRDAAGHRGRRANGDRQVSAGDRARRISSAARSSTPTRCSSTAAWTSAPPSSAPAERDGVPHHLLDIWDVTQTASVADYQDRGRACIDDVLARGVTPDLVGGSGLYRPGGARPDRVSRHRRRGARRARSRAGRPSVRRRCTQRLAGFDPAAASAIAPANGRKIVRALEVIALTGEAVHGGTSGVRRPDL